MRILLFDGGGTVLKQAIWDEQSGLIPDANTPTGEGLQDIIDKIAQITASRSDYEAVGIAITGQIDIQAQTVLFEYGGIEVPPGGRPVGGAVRRWTDKPVYVLNDSNAAALGEAAFGAGIGFPDFLCLTYGTGIGGAIIQNGRLFLGSRGIAGEFGHIVTHMGGQLHGCGHHGCYEAYASTTALVAEAQRVDPKITNGKLFFEKLPDSSALQKVLDNWIAEVCEGLASLIYVFNPSHIILGGGVMEQDLVIDKIRAVMKKRLIPTFQNVAYHRASLGNQAGLYGMAAFVKQKQAE